MSPTEALARIAELTERNRVSPDPEIERELVLLRCQAVREPDPDGVRSVFMPPDPEPGELDLASGLPTIAPGELTPGVLRAGLLQGGCLQLKGLIDRAEAARLVEGIERAVVARDVERPNKPSRIAPEWYSPLRIDGSLGLEWQRHWVIKGGGCWTADSPRNLFRLVDLLSESGVLGVISAYLGERPAVSVNKWTLRKVEPADSGAWHQDGAFLGQGIGAVNIWLALSDCGVDAPGLDVVPRRLELLPTGTEGANLDWSVSNQLVADAGLEVVRPSFEAGDALLFDERFLHRTANSPEMTNPRYAVETWCFAPSAWPNDQVPLIL